MTSQWAISRNEKGLPFSWIGVGAYWHHLSKAYGNPRFSEAILGFPLDWTALPPSETR